MESRIAGAIGMKYQPIAILWSDEKPEGAMQFEKSRWGCVMGAFGATAEKGRVAVFDRESYGCWGGGVGLGFGNAYHAFFGGMDCFCRFLSSGNEPDPKGRAVAEQCASFLRGEMREHFLHGEGYRKSPELVDKAIQNMPITEVPTRYVIFKPLAQLAEGETPVVVVFLADPDQMSALVVLANYGREDNENVIIPFGAGCQTIGIFAYREAKSQPQRAVVGLTDLSGRKYLRRLGRELTTFAVPFAMFQEMEANVEGSFLQRDTWKSLRQGV